MVGIYSVVQPIIIKSLINSSEFTYIHSNKLAYLEAALVRNSAHPLTYLLTDRGKV